MTTKFMNRTGTAFFCLMVLLQLSLHAQVARSYKDSLVVYNNDVRIVVHHTSGTVDYRFANGVVLSNTVAYVEEIKTGYLFSTGYTQHHSSTQQVNDAGGKGLRIDIQHQDEHSPVILTQHITLYEKQPLLLINVEAGGRRQDAVLATRNISPIAVLPSQNGRCFIPGEEPRILDAPFDNDNWVGSVTRRWPASGISYELSALYDNAGMSGLVLGSVQHDFWKTGIVYKTGTAKGHLDSLLVFGGVATADNKSLPPLYGGYDGTHDHAPHGILHGHTVQSPLIYLNGSKDVRTALAGYGKANVRFNGSLQWKGEAPLYWNSFGVEDVLGARNIMQPPGVLQISDFLHSLDHFNSHHPVLSIDSYDQSIYTTQVLADIGAHGAQNQQRMGFYFIPFAVWTWRDALDKILPGTNTPLREVVLRDTANQPIFYKEGNFGAYAIDPTHPVTRQRIINSLLKAKAIKASFIKIDFLSAGALETPAHYDPAVQSGMQAFNKGMKMLKHLVDSIMGPDIFITEAISPMFPHQYAHTRFVSTDVYSHLRDDEPGFPHYGSTGSSLATGSVMWWVQGTLWPYTNLDVAIMKSFQKNPDLSEQEIKVRLYAMMAMGSILGDGSDFRQPLAAERARKFLNNKALCDYFSRPKAFTPLQFADGDSFDQQMAFYLKGDTALLAMFNFSNKQTYRKNFSLASLGLKQGNYVLKDFLTNEVLGNIQKNQASFSLAVPVKDAYLVKLVPVHE